MTTKMRRFVRRASPILARLEPITIFIAYAGLAGMAFFSWFFPPKISDYVSNNNLIVESILLTVGAVMCIWGHIFKKDIVELIGLIFAIGGMFVFLWITIGILTDRAYLPVGQIVFLVVAAMGYMFSRAFLLQSLISNDWLKPPAKMFNEIYNN